MTWRSEKAGILKADVPWREQKHSKRWEVRDKLQHRIAGKEGIPVEQMKRIWHDASERKKATNPDYFHFLKQAQPAGKAYYDELVTDMTGLSHKAHTHRDREVFPGVLTGVKLVDRDQIKAERLKWKTLMMQHMGAERGVDEWHRYKHEWTNPDDKFVKEGMERIGKKRPDGRNYFYGKTEHLQPKGLKHIDPYDFYSARVSEATGIPRDSWAFNKFFRREAEKWDDQVEKLRAHNAHLAETPEELNSYEFTRSMADLLSRRLRPSIQDPDGFEPQRRQVPVPSRAPYEQDEDAEYEEEDGPEDGVVRWRRSDTM
jgi:hypothetical protein